MALVASLIACATRILSALTEGTVDINDYKKSTDPHCYGPHARSQKLPIDGNKTTLTDIAK